MSYLSQIRWSLFSKVVGVPLTLELASIWFLMRIIMLQVLCIDQSARMHAKDAQPTPELDLADIKRIFGYTSAEDIDHHLNNCPRHYIRVSPLCHSAHDDMQPEKSFTIWHCRQLLRTPVWQISLYSCWWSSALVRQESNSLQHHRDDTNVRSAFCV